MNANLQFAATTDKTATIAPGQTWVASVPAASGGVTSVTMSITSGSLVLDGATLFVFVAGTDGTVKRQKSFHCTLSQ
jgi:hypothetical protein